MLFEIIIENAALFSIYIKLIIDNSKEGDDPMRLIPFQSKEEKDKVKMEEIQSKFDTISDLCEGELNQLNLKAKNGKEISDEELLSYIKNLGKWRFALDDYSDEMTKCGFEPKYKIDGIEE